MLWLPKLDEPTSLNDLISGAIPDQRLFGWCDGERKSLTSTYRPQENALLLIGPEGDFTPEEAKTLIDRAFTLVSMGIARLRTETAAITACAWMNLAQG
ncbi:MAG: RNA methyltransferase [Flavobacteriales bacterium]|nr:RNA methyltransferase [Flavobacteriales bacterium]